jgi:hypothetical protein
MVGLSLDQDCEECPDSAAEYYGADDGRAAGCEEDRGGGDIEGLADGGMLFGGDGFGEKLKRGVK